MTTTVNARSGEITTKEIEALEQELDARRRKLRTYRVAAEFFGLSGIEIDGISKPKKVIEEMDAILGNMLHGFKKANVTVGK